jgi:hypothetical protein
MYESVFNSIDSMFKYIYRVIPDHDSDHYSAGLVIKYAAVFLA